MDIAVSRQNVATTTNARANDSHNSPHKLTVLNDDLLFKGKLGRPPWLGWQLPSSEILAASK